MAAPRSSAVPGSPQATVDDKRTPEPATQFNVASPASTSNSRAEKPVGALSPSLFKNLQQRASKLKVLLGSLQAGDGLRDRHGVPHDRPAASSPTRSSTTQTSAGGHQNAFSPSVSGAPAAERVIPASPQQSLGTPPPRAAIAATKSGVRPRGDGTPAKSPSPALMPSMSGSARARGGSWSSGGRAVESGSPWSKAQVKTPQQSSGGGSGAVGARDSSSLAVILRGGAVPRGKPHGAPDHGGPLGLRPKPGASPAAHQSAVHAREAVARSRSTSDSSRVPQPQEQEPRCAAGGPQPGSQRGANGSNPATFAAGPSQPPLPSNQVHRPHPPPAPLPAQRINSSAGSGSRSAAGSSRGSDSGGAASDLAPVSAAASAAAASTAACSASGVAGHGHEHIPPLAPPLPLPAQPAQARPSRSPSPSPPGSRRSCSAGGGAEPPEPSAPAAAPVTTAHPSGPPPADPSLPRSQGDPPGLEGATPLVPLAPQRSQSPDLQQRRYRYRQQSPARPQAPPPQQQQQQQQQQGPAPWPRWHESPLRPRPRPRSQAAEELSAILSQMDEGQAVNPTDAPSADDALIAVAPLAEAAVAADDPVPPPLLAVAPSVSPRPPLQLAAVPAPDPVGNTVASDHGTHGSVAPGPMSHGSAPLSRAAPAVGQGPRNVDPSAPTLSVYTVHSCDRRERNVSSTGEAGGSGDVASAVPEVDPEAALAQALAVARASALAAFLNPGARTYRPRHEFKTNCSGSGSSSPVANSRGEIFAGVPATAAPFLGASSVCALGSLDGALTSPRPGGGAAAGGGGLYGVACSSARSARESVHSPSRGSPMRGSNPYEKLLRVEPGGGGAGGGPESAREAAHAAGGPDPEFLRRNEVLLKKRQSWASTKRKAARDSDGSPNSPHGRLSHSHLSLARRLRSSWSQDGDSSDRLHLPLVQRSLGDLHRWAERRERRLAALREEREAEEWARTEEELTFKPAIGERSRRLAKIARARPSQKGTARGACSSARSPRGAGAAASVASASALGSARRKSTGGYSYSYSYAAAAAAAAAAAGSGRAKPGLAASAAHRPNQATTDGGDGTDISSPPLPPSAAAAANVNVSVYASPAAAPAWSPGLFGSVRQARAGTGASPCIDGQAGDVQAGAHDGSVWESTPPPRHRDQHHQQPHVVQQDTVLEEEEEDVDSGAEGGPSAVATPEGPAVARAAAAGAVESGGRLGRVVPGSSGGGGSSSSVATGRVRVRTSFAALRASRTRGRYASVGGSSGGGSILYDDPVVGSVAAAIKDAKAALQLRTHSDASASIASPSRRHRRRPEEPPLHPSPLLQPQLQFQNPQQHHQPDTTSQPRPSDPGSSLLRNPPLITHATSSPRRRHHSSGSSVRSGGGGEGQRTGAAADRLTSTASPACGRISPVRLAGHERPSPGSRSRGSRSPVVGSPGPARQASQAGAAGAATSTVRTTVTRRRTADSISVGTSRAVARSRPAGGRGGSGGGAAPAPAQPASEPPPQSQSHRRARHNASGPDYEDLLRLHLRARGAASQASEPRRQGTAGTASSGPQARSNSGRSRGGTAPAGGSNGAPSMGGAASPGQDQTGLPATPVLTSGARGSAERAARDPAHGYSPTVGFGSDVSGSGGAHLRSGNSGAGNSPFSASFGSPPPPPAFDLASPAFAPLAGVAAGGSPLLLLQQSDARPGGVLSEGLSVRVGRLSPNGAGDAGPLPEGPAFSLFDGHPAIGFGAAAATTGGTSAGGGGGAGGPLATSVFRYGSQASSPASSYRTLPYEAGGLLAGQPLSPPVLTPATSVAGGAAGDPFTPADAPPPDAAAVAGASFAAGRRSSGGGSGSVYMGRTGLDGLREGGGAPRSGRTSLSGTVNSSLPPLPPPPGTQLGLVERRGSSNGSGQLVGASAPVVSTGLGGHTTVSGDGVPRGLAPAVAALLSPSVGVGRPPLPSSPSPSPSTVPDHQASAAQPHDLASEADLFMAVTAPGGAMSSAGAHASPRLAMPPSILPGLPMAAAASPPTRVASAPVSPRHRSSGSATATPGSVSLMAHGSLPWAAPPPVPPGSADRFRLSGSAGGSAGVAFTEDAQGRAELPFPRDLSNVFSSGLPLATAGAAPSAPGTTGPPVSGGSPRTAATAADTLPWRPPRSSGNSPRGAEAAWGVLFPSSPGRTADRQGSRGGYAHSPHSRGGGVSSPGRAAGPVLAQGSPRHGEPTGVMSSPRWASPGPERARGSSPSSPRRPANNNGPWPLAVVPRVAAGSGGVCSPRRADVFWATAAATGAMSAPVSPSISSGRKRPGERPGDQEDQGRRGRGPDGGFGIFRGGRKKKARDAKDDGRGLGLGFSSRGGVGGCGELADGEPLRVAARSMSAPSGAGFGWPRGSGLELTATAGVLVGGALGRRTDLSRSTSYGFRGGGGKSVSFQLDAVELGAEVSRPAAGASEAAVDGAAGAAEARLQDPGPEVKIPGSEEVGTTVTIRGAIAAAMAAAYRAGMEQPPSPPADNPSGAATAPVAAVQAAAAAGPDHAASPPLPRDAADPPATMSSTGAAPAVPRLFDFLAAPSGSATPPPPVDPSSRSSLSPSEETQSAAAPTVTAAVSSPAGPSLSPSSALAGRASAIGGGGGAGYAIRGSGAAGPDPVSPGRRDDSPLSYLQSLIRGLANLGDLEDTPASKGPTPLASSASAPTTTTSAATVPAPARNPDSPDVAPEPQDAGGLPVLAATASVPAAWTLDVAALSKPPCGASEPAKPAAVAATTTAAAVAAALDAAAAEDPSITSAGDFGGNLPGAVFERHSGPAPVLGLTADQPDHDDSNGAMRVGSDLATAYGLVQGAYTGEGESGAGPASFKGSEGGRSTPGWGSGQSSRGTSSGGGGGEGVDGLEVDCGRGGGGAVATSAQGTVAGEEAACDDRDGDGGAAAAEANNIVEASRILATALATDCIDGSPEMDCGASGRRHNSSNSGAGCPGSVPGSCGGVTVGAGGDAVPQQDAAAGTEAPAPRESATQATAPCGSSSSSSSGGGGVHAVGRIRKDLSVAAASPPGAEPAAAASSGSARKSSTGSGGGCGGDPKDDNSLAGIPAVGRDGSDAGTGGSGGGGSGNGSGGGGGLDGGLPLEELVRRAEQLRAAAMSAAGLELAAPSPPSSAAKRGNPGGAKALSVPASPQPAAGVYAGSQPVSRRTTADAATTAAVAVARDVSGSPGPSPSPSTGTAPRGASMPSGPASAAVVAASPSTDAATIIPASAGKRNALAAATAAAASTPKPRSSPPPPPPPGANATLRRRTASSGGTGFGVTHGSSSSNNNTTGAADTDFMFPRLLSADTAGSVEAPLHLGGSVGGGAAGGGSAAAVAGDGDWPTSSNASMADEEDILSHEISLAGGLQQIPSGMLRQHSRRAVTAALASAAAGDLAAAAAQQPRYSVWSLQDHMVPGASRSGGGGRGGAGAGERSCGERELPSTAEEEEEEPEAAAVAGPGSGTAMAADGAAGAEGSVGGAAGVVGGSSQQPQATAPGSSVAAAAGPPQGATGPAANSSPRSRSLEEASDALAALHRLIQQIGEL